IARIYGVGEGYLIFDDSGDVFEIQSAAHTVLRRRTDGSLVWQVGGFGMGPGQLNYPTGLLLDRQGPLYVVDHGKSRILVYGADGTYLRQVGGRTADDVDDPMELDFCRAVALGSDQRLYVCDTRDYQIQVFERDGTAAGAFGAFGDNGQDPESLNN